MDYKQFDFYQKLKIQIGDWLKEKESEEFKWKKYVALMPDCFYFVAELAADKSLSVTTREKLAKVIAYVISPWDFLPEEVVGPAGFLDDITVCAVILNQVIFDMDIAVWSKYWKREKDLHSLIKSVLNDAEEMLGKELNEKILAKFSD